MPDEHSTKSPESLTITFREAVVLVGVSRNTLYKSVKAGKVPGAQNLGNWYRFHRALLLAWLEGGVPRRGGAGTMSFDGDRRGEKGGRRGEDRAGLAWHGTHVLRKTCGTRIADGGGGVAAVATHLRHKSMQTASRYIDRRGASSRALNALETSWRRGSEPS